jgi:protease-4
MEENNKVPFKRLFWSSFLAILSVSSLGFVFILFLIGAIAGGIMSGLEPDAIALKENSILHLKLEGKIGEKSMFDVNLGALQINKSLGLPDIQDALQAAEKEDKIKALYIDIGNIQCGISTARSIRNAILAFRKNSKKKVFTYYQGEQISQVEFYIGSAGEKTYAFPTTNFMLTGLGGEFMFFKRLLDTLDVEVQVIRGEDNDFKSAVEPFFLTQLSDSAKHQSKVLLASMWHQISQDICSSRGIKEQDWNQWLDEMRISNANEALRVKLIDGLAYADEMSDKWVKSLNLTSEKDLNFIPFETYARERFKSDQLLAQTESNAIAVIIAEGEIATEGRGINSVKLCKQLKEIRNNDSIKAVVLRINSPGGSALASEEIWREITLLKRKKKVVVSMGDVAASGGYYMASAGDVIFSEPTTVTGSIGVFGMIPYTGKMFSNKLGITFDTVQTNRHGVMSINKKLNPFELSVVQTEVNAIYAQFLDRVVKGRKIPLAQVKSIARGRVWSGVDALNLKLVDQLGGLEDAIAFAKASIGDKNAPVVYYPKVKDEFWENVLNDVEEDENSLGARGLVDSMPRMLVESYEKLKSLESKMGIQMRMPYDWTVRF